MDKFKSVNHGILKMKWHWFGDRDIDNSPSVYSDS